MKYPAVIKTIPALAELPNSVNYFHVRTLESPQTLREFISACLSYMPGWMRFLYRVREYFVLLLGTRQEERLRKVEMAPEDISFNPGDLGAFFTVQAGEEDSYWLGEARDEIIAGSVGFICEAGASGVNRFHLITTATYLRWTSRIYFNAIRPFHHLVVYSMIRHALNKARAKQ